MGRADDALALTAAIEGDSEHTIARGIRNAAEEQELSLPDVSDFEAIKGRGVKAQYEGRNRLRGRARACWKCWSLTLPDPIAVFAEEANREGAERRLSGRMTSR